MPSSAPLQCHNIRLDGLQGKPSSSTPPAKTGILKILSVTLTFKHVTLETSSCHVGPGNE